MLRLILGRAGAGKTDYVRKVICRYAEEGRKGIFLVVPDQFSFESEKAMLDLLGASNAASVEALGFSRLCDVVFKQYGGRSLPETDDGGKAVLMRFAIEECADFLDLYRKSSDREDFVYSMLETAEEFKAAGVTPDILDSAALLTSAPNLSLKLKELSLIMRAYNSALEKDYFDPSEKPDLLYKKAAENQFFKGKTVVFDSFFHFTEQQLKIVELAISQADDVIVTFCLGSLDEKEPVFSEIRKYALRLISIAAENGVETASPVVLAECKRYRNTELEALEKGVFSTDFETFEGTPENITVCRAKTRYDEADYIARTIVNLTRDHGYRWRDFAIIARNDDICKNAVYTALDKYNISYFADRRLPIKYQPVIRYVMSALRLCEKFSTEAFFALLKTGLAGPETEEISALENYAFVWSLNGEAWFEDFTLNPEGFSDEFGEKQKKQLEDINRIRRQAVEPLKVFIKRVNGLLSAEKISSEIFRLLKENGVARRLANIAQDDAQASVYAQVWDELMKILDQIAVTSGERKVGAAKYLQLFKLVISEKTIGNIPQRIDEVSIGNAERIRPAAPKVVFIVGANDRQFPKAPSAGGMLTPFDRSELIKNGINVNDCGENEMTRENSLAYNAVCAPSERLFVTYSERDASGTALYPSQIVTDIHKIFPDISEYEESSYRKFSDERCLEPVVSLSAALEKSAMYADGKTEFSASLKKALSENPETSEIAERIEKFSCLLPENITPKTAGRIFKNIGSVSPSSVERFFRCPFQYFCMYGMKAKKRKAAEMDSQNRGSLVHYCLERLIVKYGSDGLCGLSEKEIKQDVVVFLKYYLDNVLGGAKNKSKRFLRNYMMTAELIKRLAVIIAREFGEGSFKTAFCELEIGESPSSKVRPIKVKMPDGTEVGVRGVVDRVDTAEHQGKTLIRVIDYKTGVKTLTPTEIYNGIGLQMPLYLFCLCENGEELFGSSRVPAAVLYMRAKDYIINASRSSTEDEINDAVSEKSKFDGIILSEDGVIDAMDKNRALHGNAKYLKLGYKSDGSLSKKTGLVSLEEMAGIERRIEELLTEMNRELKNGNIAADPLDISSSDDGCRYCDYESVCRIEKGTAHRTAKEVTGYGFKPKEEKK